MGGTDLSSLWLGVSQPCSWKVKPHELTSADTEGLYTPSALGLSVGSLLSALLHKGKQCLHCQGGNLHQHCLTGSF